MTRRVCALAAFASGLALDQNAKLTFEAASVKPSSPAAGPFTRTMGGPGTRDPGRIRYINIPLKSLMIAAFGVSNYQIAGPGWLETDRFDLDAAIPAGGPPAMVQFVLGSRARLIGRQQTMRELASRLARTTMTRIPMLAMPSGVEMPPETEPAPSLGGALDAQLGLNLQSKRAPMEVIVVDRVERAPSAN